MSVGVLSKDTFHEAISGGNPVIVDFYADWCQPCKRITPILEEIADENKGKVDVYKVNTDRDPDLAMEYSVQSIPNIVSFKDGKIYKRVVGAAPKEELLELIL